MKKLFFKAIPFGIAFFLSAAPAKAQVTSELRDYYDSTLVTNDTLHFWVGVGQLHASHINQHNIGANQEYYRFTKIYVQMQPGADGNFCIFHNDDQLDPQSQCYTPSVFTSANFVTDPGEYNTLVADFMPGTQSTGISIIRYRIWNINNPADTVNITMVYNVTPVGMAEGFTNENLGLPYPVPSSGIVTIPVNSAGDNRTLVITNSMGQTVAEMAIGNSTAVEINMSAWSPGVYFVAMISDEGVLARRKLIRE